MNCNIKSVICGYVLVHFSVAVYLSFRKLMIPLAKIDRESFIDGM